MPVSAIAEPRDPARHRGPGRGDRGSRRRHRSMFASAWPPRPPATMPVSSSTWCSATPRCIADVVLLDVDIPADLAAAFGGPRHGIDGLRRRAGAFGRALTCSALKPQGLPPARLAELAEQFARGGIDFIKDDHGLADQTLLAVRRACRRDRRQRRPGHALRAQPVRRSRRDAAADRHRVRAWHRHGDDRADDRRLGDDAGAGAAISRHRLLRPSHHGRRGAHRAGPADRQAVPPAGRRCGDLPQPWRPLRLHAGDLPPPRRPGARAVGRHPPQRAGARRRHDAGARARDA